MPVAFSRSLRSLEVDNFRRSRISVYIVVVVMGLWLAWFGLAQVTLYATSASAVILHQPSLSPLIRATFLPTPSLMRVQPGQAAYFIVGDDSLPAFVTAKSDHLTDGQIEIEFALQADPASLALPSGLSGVVKLAVEQVSPAELAFRAMRQTLK